MLSLRVFAGLFAVVSAQFGGSYDKYMKQYAGSYSKYMNQASGGASAGGYGAYMKQYAGDYSKYMNQGSSGGSAGGYDKYMNQYAGEYMGQGSSSSSPLGQDDKTSQKVSAKKNIAEGKKDDAAEKNHADVLNQVFAAMPADPEKQVAQQKAPSDAGSSAGGYGKYMDQYAGSYSKYMRQGGMGSSAGDPSQYMKQYAGSYSKYMNQGGSGGSAAGYSDHSKLFQVHEPDLVAQHADLQNQLTQQKATSDIGGSAGDYGKFMSQYAGNYSKYMSQGGGGSSAASGDKYMEENAGDYAKYMSQGSASVSSNAKLDSSSAATTNKMDKQSSEQKEKQSSDERVEKKDDTANKASNNALGKSETRSSAADAVNQAPESEPTVLDNQLAAQKSGCSWMSWVPGFHQEGCTGFWQASQQPGQSSKSWRSDVPQSWRSWLPKGIPMMAAFSAAAGAGMLAGVVARVYRSRSEENAVTLTPPFYETMV